MTLDPLKPSEYVQPPRDWTPQKFDSIVRTITTSVISLALVTAVILETVLNNHASLTPLDASLVGWAGIVIGFYYGGHTAQNTAALEEQRLLRTADASEASAMRSELAADR